MLKMGSLFSGVGGLELGLERAFNSHLNTVWQVEQNKFCLSILERHWPHTTRYTDVRTVGAHNLEPVDIICAGFPCQSISIAGLKKGLADENKSGLWWQVHRIVSEFQSIGHQPILVLENVANILRLGGRDVVGSLAQIGYDCEWTVISARQCGAPHVRKRWFCVAYPNSIAKSQAHSTIMSIRKTGDSRNCIGGSNRGNDSTNTNSIRPNKAFDWGTASVDMQGRKIQQGRPQKQDSTNTIGNSEQQPTHTGSMEQGWGPQRSIREGFRHNEGAGYWRAFPTQSPVCRRDDGVPNRVDRLKALGNAVVPQCSEWVGQQIIKSGLLERLCLANN